MSARKPAVGFSDTAFDYAYAHASSTPANTRRSARLSGELVRAEIGREREAELFAAEVQRRSALPPRGGCRLVISAR